MGYLLVNVQLPDSASPERTDERDATDREDRASRRRASSTSRASPASRSRSTPSGSNFGSMFIILDALRQAARSDAVERRDRRPSCASSFAQRSPTPWCRCFRRRRSAAWAGPAASSSWSRTAATSGSRRLQEQTENLVEQGQRAAGSWSSLFTVFRANVPHAARRARTARVHGQRASTCSDFADTLQVYLGSLYVNDFNLFGRTWQVIVQAEQRVPRPARGHHAGSRSATPTGTMVPAGLAGRRPRGQRPAGPDALQHVPRRADQRQRGAGRQLRRRRSPSWSNWPSASCRKSMAFEWTEMTYLELHGRQHGDDRSSPSPSCSSSWCWRRSTRAGRCRWRSSWSCRCACLARSPA